MCLIFVRDFYSKEYISINIYSLLLKKQGEWKYLFDMKSPLLFTPKQTLKKVKFSQNFSIEKFN
jgi:hypothetical protein